MKKMPELKCVLGPCDGMKINVERKFIRNDIVKVPKPLKPASSYYIGKMEILDKIDDLYEYYKLVSFHWNENRIDYVQWFLVPHKSSMYDAICHMLNNHIKPKE